MISNFPARSASNIGGSESFQFSPIGNIVSFPSAPGKVISAAPVFVSGSFLTGYATLETLKFSETANKDAGGPYYDWKIDGFAPGDSDELAQLMEEMEQTRHVVVTKDMAGIRRFVGYQAPLDFTAVYSPGDDVSQARGYQFSFVGSGPKRAPVYAVT